MLVLGIDPGMSRTGYGFVEGDGDFVRSLEFGTIATRSSQEFPLRLQKIYEGVRGLIEAHRPEWIALESPFLAKNVQSAMKLGQSKGAALLAAVHGGIPIAEYTPTQVKSAVTGYGAADKTQIQQMVKRVLRLKELPQPADAADALAIALCHIYCHSKRVRLGLSS
ncbi:MAG: crossover junction endodeoxyribonuclease RuvC [candidate division NC10 bacterium]|nr:crossover junction endodeoxyribonuclease RuvC [candidate division NC10 bacterium]